jgi:hypothetical protein
MDAAGDSAHIRCLRPSHRARRGALAHDVVISASKLVSQCPMRTTKSVMAMVGERCWSARDLTVRRARYPGCDQAEAKSKQRAGSAEATARRG